MNDKIVIFDLFDTLLTKVWFDYDKGLAYLADTYLDGKREELKLYSKEYRERFMLKRNETQIETSFIKQLEFYERKFEKALSKPYDEIEWEFFPFAVKKPLRLEQKTFSIISANEGIRLPY